MGAPWTQEYIQNKIDFFADQIEVIAETQRYSGDQGPAGQFENEKAKLTSVQASMDSWIGYMEKYYPDAYSNSGEQIEIWNAGINEG